MQSTGLVLAAGGIAAANEVIFAPLADAKSGKLPDSPWSAFNWRLIPATVILALVLGGLESLSPDFAKALAGLVLLTVIITPYGNAPAPIDNITKAMGL